MTENYLFELVLEARDNASPGVQQLNSRLAEARALLAALGEEATQSSARQVAAEQQVSQAATMTAAQRKAALADATAFFKQVVNDEIALEQRAAQQRRQDALQEQADLARRKSALSDAAATLKQHADAEVASERQVEQASKQAAAAAQQGAAQKVAAWTQAGGVATQFAQGIAQGIGIAVPLSIAAATSAVTRFAVDAAKGFGEFERGTREIVTLTGQTGASAEAFFGQVGQQIREFSVRMGVDAVDATKALYEIMSSGVEKPADAMQVLNVAAKAAVGGVTSLHTAADAIVGALNAYGLEADQATKVSDILFSAVRDGRIRWDELGRSLGYVFPTAHQVGVTMEEVAAALAAMTNEGVVSQTAMIQLNQVLTSVIKPSKDAKAAAAEMGLEWSTDALAAKGLYGFLKDLDEATGGNAEQIARLVPEIRGMRGVWELTGESLVRFKEYSDNARNSLGFTQQAVEEVNKSGGRAFDQLNAELDELNRKIGEALVPHLADAVATVTVLGAKLGAWPSDVPTNDQLQRTRQFVEDLRHLADAAANVVNPVRAIGDAAVAAAAGVTKAAAGAVEGQVAFQRATQATNDYIAGLNALNGALEKGQITQEEYDAKLADLAKAYATATGALKDNLDQHERHTAGIQSNAAATDAAAEATKRKTAATKAASEAERNYQERLGNIEKLVAAGIITEEEAAERRKRITADRDAALKASANAQSEANRTIDEQLRLVAAGALSVRDFGNALKQGEGALRDLTREEYEAKLKAIADALAGGAISAKDAESQTRALANAYEQQLTKAAQEAAREVEQNEKKQSDARARAADIQRDLQRSVEKDVREGLERVAAINQKHDDDLVQAEREAAEKRKEIERKATDDRVAEDVRYIREWQKTFQELSDLEAGRDDASQERAVRLARQNEDRIRAAADLEAKFDDQRVENRTRANERLAEIDRKYGHEGSGGTEGADSEQRRIDRTEDARKAANDRVAEADARHREQVDDADERRADARADAEQRRNEQVADARQRLNDAIHDADLRQLDQIADAEQRRIERVADEAERFAGRAADRAQRAIDRLGDKDPEAGRKGAAENAAFEKSLGEELSRHEAARNAAGSDAERAAERQRHEEAQRLLEEQHADRLKQIALESEALTDADREAFEYELKVMEREHRQRLDDLQDETDARKEEAERAHEDALAKADEQFKDAQAKAQAKYEDAQKKADDAHEDALKKAQKQFDDAKAKAAAAFKDAEEKANAAHARDLAQIRAKWEEERQHALDEQNKRFAEIDAQEAKEKLRIQATYDEQDKRELEDFTRRQNNTKEHLRAEIDSQKQRHDDALEKINKRAEADVEATNTALTKAQEKIDEQRRKDFDKYHQDLVDRFTDLENQWRDRMSDLDKMIPGDVRKLLNGGAALISGALASAGSAARGRGIGLPSAGDTGGARVATGTAVDDYLSRVAGGGPLPDYPGSLEAFKEVLAAFDEARARIDAQQAEAAERELRAHIGGDSGAASGRAPGASGTSGTSGAESALNWMLSRVGQAIYQGFCEKFVENAFGTDLVFGSAAEAARALQTNPGGSMAAVPRGKLMFFRPDSTNDYYGHIGVSLGDGRFVSAITTGVAVQPPSPYWSRLFSGWGEPRFRRQFGGDVEEGGTYLINEQRQGGPGEVFVAPKNGTILSQLPDLDYNRLADLIGMAVARHAHQTDAAPARTVTINANGTDPAGVVRDVTAYLRRQELLDRAALGGAR